MGSRTSREMSRRARRHFVLEQLERREMLSATAAVQPVANSADVRGLSRPVLATRAPSVTGPAASGLRNIPMPIAALVTTRSFDGTGNNVANPEWGSAGEQLLRVAPAQYGDGISTPGGDDRPSPREISNVLVAQSEDTPANDRQLSAFIYVWGQFIDHDIDLTEPPESNYEAYSIAVPPGDAMFDPDGTGTQVIRFNRSRYDETTGIDVDNPREQINQISAWIDGSMVYGSDQATAESLRTFSGGRLKTSDGDLPPVDAEGNFLAGDLRVNENIELTSMHALFLREHNWWADRIAARNPGLSDEQIFQQARAIVIAEIQVITYNEFLPALLGRGVMSSYQGYDPLVDPSVANEFSTAAFRMHSFINDDVEFFGNDGRAVHEEVALRDAFNNPDLLRATGPDSILKYLASTTAQELDIQIVDSLRNFLFGQPGQGGFDLASLNIQRGRDHGLADYNTVREAYGLARAESFADISSDPEVRQALEALYGTVDNIDLWVGGLAEDHLAGSSVGELIQTIVVDQFERLRDGDRFWYRNIFSRQDAAQLERTTLADIIRRNSQIANVQNDVFFMRASVAGQVFVDTNANGRHEHREVALSGATVQLLDDEGAVIATAVTDREGRYRFSQFSETGDFQVRVVAPADYSTESDTLDLLITRGGTTLSGLNFALRPVHRASVADLSPERERLAAVDSVFDSVSPEAGFSTINGAPKR